MKTWENFLKVDGWRSGITSVDMVLRHYARQVRSEKTRENVCTTLTSFCRFSTLNPDALVQLTPQEASRCCQDFTDHLRDKGYSIRYVNVSQAYLKAFFRANGYENEKKLKIERYHQPTRYRKKAEYIPTPEEIERIGYASGSAKNRTMILMLFTSGLRNSTLRALLYKDVKKELERGLNVVKIPVYPEMKKVSSAACKGDIPYHTFMDPNTSKSLREYLEQRRKDFGGIADEEPLFCSDSNLLSPEKQRQTPVSKNGLERMVKRAAKQAGIEQWENVTPKCLRKAFESALRNNRLDVKDQEFLMGHILEKSQDAYYDYSKSEDLRAKYAQITFFAGTKQDKLEMIKVFAETLGVKGIELKIQKTKEKQKDMDDMEALGKVMREELGIKPLETKMVKYRKKNEDCNNHKKYESKVVDERELLSHIDDGWEIVRELKNGKLAIRRELA